MISGLKYDNTDISRIEVIGPNGREFTRYLTKNEKCSLKLQDGNNTLKLFIIKEETTVSDMSIWFVNANFVATLLPEKKDDGINALYFRNEYCPDFHLNGVLFVRDYKDSEYTKTLVKLRSFKEFIHEVGKIYDIVEEAKVKAALGDPDTFYE